MKRSYIFMVTVIVALYACSNSEKRKGLQKETVESNRTTVEAGEKKPLLVSEKSFFGITPGSPISDYKDIVTKGRIRTGEGVIEVFNIEQKGQEIGYFLPSEEDERMVGRIFIQSSKAITEHGFKVGTAFRMILEEYPNAEVRGTEIENRAVVVLGKTHYQLNFVSDFPYIEQSSIPEDATVKEIVIVP